MQLTSLFVLRTPGLKKKKARALSPTYALVLYTFYDPPPPRACASPSLLLSPSCVVCAIANPLYQLSKELLPKVFLAVTIIYRSISIKSPAPSFCALSVSSLHWFRRNLRDTPLVHPQEHNLLHLEGAHARPHVAHGQSESRKVSLSLAARGLDPVVKAYEECEMRHFASSPGQH